MGVSKNLKFYPLFECRWGLHIFSHSRTFALSGPLGLTNFLLVHVVIRLFTCEVVRDKGYSLDGSGHHKSSILKIELDEALIRFAY